MRSTESSLAVAMPQGGHLGPAPGLGSPEHPNERPSQKRPETVELHSQQQTHGLIQW